VSATFTVAELSAFTPVAVVVSGSATVGPPGVATPTKPASDSSHVRSL
jgi:hypothetical protein